MRTILLRQDLATKIILYRQAREENQEKITAQSPFLISLCNRHYKQRLSRQGIAQIVTDYLKKCNLQNKDLSRNVSPHSLRHTAGTLSLQNGSETREVQDFLGHADPKTTAIYTHVLNSQEHNPAGKINVHL